MLLSSADEWIDAQPWPECDPNDVAQVDNEAGHEKRKPATPQRQKERGKEKRKSPRW